MTDVAIVGGGISGLAAAYHLTRYDPALGVTLVEQDRRLGGKILTERAHGFVIEGGPDSFLASKPRGIGLARELGLEQRLQGTNPAARRTWVMQGGRLHPLPEGLSGLVPSRLEPLLESDLFSPSGKDRLRQEPTVPVRVGDEDESLASFITRRFGPEVYDRLIEPLMAGIYAGDGEQLSVGATFPQLRQMEQECGSVLTGIQATQRRHGTPTQRSGFLTPAGGMGEFVDLLRHGMPQVQTRTAVEVRAVTESRGGFDLRLSDGSHLSARTVIVATPALTAAHLLTTLDADMAAALESIPHVSSATVSLAYEAVDVPRATEGYGYVVPRMEGRPVLASTWTSTKFRQRAPEGYALIRVFIGRAGQQDVLAQSDADLVAIAAGEVADVLGTRVRARLHRLFRWPNGMPQYTMGHVERVRLIESLGHRHPGLFLAGNAYHGVGIPDCIASGEQAACAAIDHVARISGRAHR